MRSIGRVQPAPLCFCDEPSAAAGPLLRPAAACRRRETTAAPGRPFRAIDPIITGNQAALGTGLYLGCRPNFSSISFPFGSSLVSFGGRSRATSCRRGRFSGWRWIKGGGAAHGGKDNERRITVDDEKGDLRQDRDEHADHSQDEEEDGPRQVVSLAARPPSPAPRLRPGAHSGRESTLDSGPLTLDPVAVRGSRRPTGP